MPQPHAPAIGPLESVRRALGRMFGAGGSDPLQTRLSQASHAGTPLTPEEAADIAIARAEIRQGDSTTDPLGRER